MKSVTLFLNYSNAVKDFVNIMSRYSFDADLRSGRYVVDAKSLLGIFSLDLSKPITLEIHDNNCDALLADLTPYLCR